MLSMIIILLFSFISTALSGSLKTAKDNHTILSIKTHWHKLVYLDLLLRNDLFNYLFLDLNIRFLGRAGFPPSCLFFMVLFILGFLMKLMTTSKSLFNSNLTKYIRIVIALPLKAIFWQSISIHFCLFIDFLSYKMFVYNILLLVQVLSKYWWLLVVIIWYF